MTRDTEPALNLSGGWESGFELSKQDFVIIINK
jgi:hypothetical protein